LIPIIFVFFFLDVFDTVGTLVGVGSPAGFFKDKKLPRANQAMLADAIGTVAGTLLGTSTVSSYVESSTVIAQGARTGLANLKVGYNRVHGYFIELPSKQAEQAPIDYQRRQTLKGAERFITPELKAFEDKALSAKSRALARERCCMKHCSKT